VAEPEQAVAETPKPPERPKSTAGLKTKLTPELQDEMCANFKLGLTTRPACDLSMVSETSFNTWVSIGKADERAGKKSGLFLAFLVAIRQAQTEFRAQHVRDIGANHDWRAKAWLLERVRPDDYG
jgi:hypothetical protein